MWKMEPQALHTIKNHIKFLKNHIKFQKIHIKIQKIKIPKKIILNSKKMDEKNWNSKKKFI